MAMLINHIHFIDDVSNRPGPGLDRRPVLQVDLDAWVIRLDHQPEGERGAVTWVPMST